MERQPDRCGAGHRPGDCRPSSSATGRGRVRGCADPEAFARLGQTAHLRWCRRGQTNRAGLFGVSQIVLVQDNLNTHKPASLYEAFPAAEARQFVERFEWHYTPKHGSWLDMAKSELGVVSSQCLDRRIPDKQTLIEEVAAWEDDRNKNHTKADWQFTTADARIKLKRLYPTL